MVLNTIRMIICCLLFAFVALFSNCGMSEDKVKDLITTDDGFDIVYATDYQTVYLLFDDVGILFEGLRSSDQWIVTYSPAEGQSEDAQSYKSKEEMYANYEIEKKTSTKGNYTKCAFSPDGYVAYASNDKSSETAQNGYNHIEYFIYSTEDESLSQFETMQELTEYAQANNIDLGTWRYFNKRFSVEKQIETNADWSVYTTDFDISFVRHQANDMFSGEIDKILSAGDYLAFHIKMVGDLNSVYGLENPYLPTGDREPIYYTWTRTVVYYDNYIVVNTDDDNFEFFDEREEAESYLDSKDVQVTWSKVKYP